MHNIKTSLPNTLDALLFAYCSIRSTDDAISTTYKIKTPMLQFCSSTVHRHSLSMTLRCGVARERHYYEAKLI